MMSIKILLTFLATSALLLFVGVAQAEDTSGNGYDSAIRTFLLIVAGVIGLIVFLIGFVKKRSAISRNGANENNLDKGESNK